MVLHWAPQKLSIFQKFSENTLALQLLSPEVSLCDAENHFTGLDMKVLPVQDTSK